MQEYVLGFMFDEEDSHVLLIEKQKPDWQKGLMNGIGGKVEESEIPIDAMVREFNEETGIQTAKAQWRHKCTLSGGGWKVFVYKAHGPVESASTMEAEQVSSCDTSALPTTMVSNLSWIIPMLMDSDNFYTSTLYTDDFDSHIKK